jgi:hypothetical protein
MDICIFAKGATPTVLHFLFDKRWSLPTLKSIWEEKKRLSPTV